MKVYLITQDQYQIESCGDITTDECIIHGIYTDKAEAIIFAKNIEVQLFESQFSDAANEVNVYEITSNTKTNNIDDFNLIFVSTLDDWVTGKYVKSS